MEKDRTPEETKKRFDDHEAYIILCKYLWIEDFKRYPVFGINNFYEHAQRILKEEAYQYRLKNLLDLARFVNTQLEEIKK